MSLTKCWDTTKKIIAIGRNFADHAKELGNAVPKKPFFFLKPSSSIITKGKSIIIPKNVQELHHEVELAVVIGKKGKDIPIDDAMNYVSGYTIALDMTARDLQNEAKSKGFPWSEAKGYDTFCPLGDFVPVDKIKDPHNLNIWLKVDDEVRQEGNTNLMMFKIPQLISYVSSVMTLEKDDIILTGTPKGVGKVNPGQTIRAGIEYIGEIEYPVIKQE